MSLLFYTVAVFGLCYILGHAKISLRARVVAADFGGLALWLVELVECPACLGTWLGFAAGFLWPSLVPFGYAPVMLALWTCGTGYILGRSTGWLTEPGRLEGD
jgi:hypothetical protein